MEYAESILDLVGHTPLVRLSRRDAGTSARSSSQPLVLAKLEMLNPGGSVKDRIGLPMIEAAERAGLLRPGGTIIEPTIGNTGHGLAIAAALQGLSLHLRHGRQAVVGEAGAPPGLRRRGRALPDERPAGIARELLLGRGAARPRHPGRLQAGPVLEPWRTRRPTSATTGPEIWEQTEGRITHLVASVGTGGTISGAAHYLAREAAGSRGRRRRPGGQRPLGRHRPPVPDRGRRRGLLPRAPTTRRVVDRWVRVSRSRRLRDGPPADPRGGDPRRRVVRHRARRGPDAACAT